MSDSVLSNLKLFGVGLPKTGLSSLSSMLKLRGIEIGRVDSVQRRLFFDGTDYMKVLENYDTATFFCDTPTYLMYKIAFEKYGESSRFILTVRKDGKLWFESLKRHSLYAHPIKHNHRRIYGRFYPNGFDEEHIAYYDRHNAEVARFFAERSASHLLLTLRVDEPDAVYKLSRFLDINFDVPVFPRENVSSSDRPGFSNLLKKNYNIVIQKLYETIVPRVSTHPPKQAAPIEPPGLSH